MRSAALALFSLLLLAARGAPILALTVSIAPAQESSAAEAETPAPMDSVVSGCMGSFFDAGLIATDAACASLRRAEWGGGAEVLGPAREGRVDYVVGIFVAWRPSAFKKDAWIPGSAEYRILRVSDGELAASGRLEGPADSESVAAAAARNAESFGASLGALCLAVFEARIPGGKP
ncbi:MAG TPA: hypothetical protein P5133_07190 [Spirochaetia bacterium]|nr:hypothetical protein [Spirochaetia bacterium]HRZ64693.1 hypothetical protein [Spirochaetia bacterium]